MNRLHDCTSCCQGKAGRCGVPPTGVKKNRNILETEEERIEQDGESDTSAGDEVEAEMKA